MRLLSEEQREGQSDDYKLSKGRLNIFDDMPVPTFCQRLKGGFEREGNVQEMGNKRVKETEIDRLAATYQFGRGHPILLDVSLQISRQLQGHLTYFFPVGGFLMG